MNLKENDYVKMPKESVTQLREILATLTHFISDAEGQSLINEAFNEHLGLSADGFEHFKEQE